MFLIVFLLLIIRVCLAPPLMILAVRVGKAISQEEIACDESTPLLGNIQGESTGKEAAAREKIAFEINQRSETKKNLILMAI